MIRKLFETDSEFSRTVLRVLLGVVFIPHGTQKLLGWFGGGGFSASLHFFNSMHHIPVAIAVLPILTESFGAAALILGFFTRIAAFAVAVDMVVAVWLVHLRNGFFMNWAGHQKGEGFEYHILVVAIAVALAIGGGGRWALDRVIARRLRK